MIGDSSDALNAKQVGVQDCAGIAAVTYDEAKVAQRRAQLRIYGAPC